MENRFVDAMGQGWRQGCRGSRCGYKGVAQGSGDGTTIVVMAQFNILTGMIFTKSYKCDKIA